MCRTAQAEAICNSDADLDAMPVGSPRKPDLAQEAAGDLQASAPTRARDIAESLTSDFVSDDFPRPIQFTAELAELPSRWLRIARCRPPHP